MSGIILKGIEVHNLQSVDVTIPYQKLTVISGLSGSGKSSLAIDTLYAEGQRRFIESLSAYVRQFLERMERPRIAYVSGMLPSIALEAKNSISNARSTVGTQTELNDYLRVLMARIGKTYCYSCASEVIRDIPTDIAAWLLKEKKDQRLYISFPVRFTDYSKKYVAQYIQEILKQGFSRIMYENKVESLEDEAIAKCIKDKKLFHIVVDRLVSHSDERKRIIDSLEIAYRHGRGHLSVWHEESKAKIIEHVFSEGFHCPRCDIEYSEPTPQMFSFNSPLGACTECQGFGRVITIDPHLVIPDENKSIRDGAIVPWTTKAAQWEYNELKKMCKRHHISVDKSFKSLSAKHRKLIFEGDDQFYGINGFFKYLETKKYKMHVRVFLSRYRSYVTCNECQGKRLKKNVQHVRMRGKNMCDITAMSVDQLHAFFHAMTLTNYETSKAGTVLEELRTRVSFLKDVGLGYLSLDRLSRTLSGGETQRINLASALGASLVDTLYVLDEPSIGLHARDNAMLIAILKALKKLGNTVVVIEHDREMIENADHVIDLGPFAGVRGGKIMYQGTPKGLLRSRKALTARYLRGEEKIVLDKVYRTKENKEKVITICGAQEHNLKKISVKIPLGVFVAITGVSGSGKSTLLYDVIYNNFLRARGRSVTHVGKVDKIEGYEHISDIILIDQKPIGRTPRSNPATFIGVFSAIRTLFGNTRDAKRRRMSPRHFSFNVEGGRCSACKGDGRIKVEMHFLADVYVVCEACQGKRYGREVLDVRYKDKNIDEVLQMTIDDALEFFNDSQTITSKLQVLSQVGLGYLTLGQPAPTLSAGEAQRLKLALELVENRKQNVLFLFDEPTVGLHYHDIQALMRALEKLLVRGNSIIMIEHNIEVIKCADYIIDLGPEGGNRGGKIIAKGTPHYVAKSKHSYTGQYLKELL